ncbi:hypothetical protein B0H10DRAFT_2039895 [Mycena sp. CBHHK59/15]|nr:hypothetical protein B0H10DRAFT_2039895 [Mycena sp. CBHHK59/15]
MSPATRLLAYLLELDTFRAQQRALCVSEVSIPQIRERSRGFYPVLTLPLEITTEIFIRCLPLLGDCQPDRNSAPMLLLRICRSWSMIARATPALWATLTLDINRLPVALYATGRFEEFVQTWLGRALGHRLSLYLQGYVGGELATGRLYHAIAPLATQIYHLELRMDKNFYARGSDIRALTFPSLHTLTVLGGNTVGDPIQNFRDAKQLREVHLMNSTALSHILLPWTRLTIFTGSYFSDTECLNVLRSAPFLVNCTFEFIQTDNTVHPVPLCHLSLQDLTIHGSFGAVLQSLDLPALRKLHLDRVILHTQDVSSFLSRSSVSWRTSRIHPAVHDGDRISVKWIRDLSSTSPTAAI